MTDEEFRVFKLRRIALQVAWSLYGTPYRYGGPQRGPEDGPWFFGLDCSGLTCEYLASVGLIGSGERLSAAMQFGRFARWKTEEPVYGGLVFWMNGTEANHVCITIGGDLCLGAIGGGRDVTTLDIALERDARVKVRPLGYRTGRRAYCDPFQSIAPSQGGAR